MKNKFIFFNALALATIMATIGCSSDDDNNQATTPTPLSIQDLDVSIDENPTNGQVIGTPTAAGQGTLVYSITSQIPAGATAIDPATGELTVADETLFDFETNPTINVTISVSNSTDTETGMVEINLNNINEVGDFNFGGVIFWVDPADNSHGLVSSINAQNSGASTVWYNGVNTDTSAVATAIGTGQANTTAIINNQGVGTYAASICDNLTLNNYTDWFLPSYDELNEMNLKRSITNPTAIANGGTSFESIVFYWTSTQQNGNANNAYILYTGGGNLGLNAKGNSAWVRAVRAF